VGTVGAGALLIGKYVMDASPLLYAGLTLLVGFLLEQSLKLNTV
jgi:hypothetical protein